ncbi:MAG: hypothetical protein GY839_21965 [candidate division Zixibacteria bacterium]|nr:hypothetical protein [candidate division Zixibacteria bacterium]
MKYSRVKYKGFTLIEVVLIIVIIGIVGSIALRSLQSSTEQIRETATREEMELLEKAIIGEKGLVESGIRSNYGYVGDVGSLPPDLDALVANPGGYSTWKGPYINNDFIEAIDDYKKDGWGTLYTYTGGVTITSTGGGSSISKQIARNSSDLTSNTVWGYTFDKQGNQPGDSSSSIIVTLFYPDGSGSMTSSSLSPNSAGRFSFDNSIPIGNHLVRAVYSSANDTTAMYASVTPIGGAYVDLLFTVDFASGSEPDSSFFYISTAGSATLGGTTFQDEDIVKYFYALDDAIIFLDGSSIFSGDEDIDAMHILANGNIAISTTEAAQIGALSFIDEDIVEYNPSSGLASLIFDGGAIFSGNEDVDAIYIYDNGHILLSTTGSATINGTSFDEEDLVDYDPVANTATIVFDGSAIFSNSADINAVHILDSDNYIISTTSSETIGALSFDDEDLAEYDPSSGIATMFFDGDVPFGTSTEDIDAVHVGDGSGALGGGSSSQILRPDGNGSQINLTNSGCGSNYQCVDESSSDDDATIVIRASSSYSYDLYSLENPADTSGSVVSVTVYCRAKRTKNQGSIMPETYIGSTKYSGAEQSLTDSYADYSHTWVVNPNSSVAWTWQDVINLEAGVSIKGQNSNFPAYCTQVWVEIAH